MGGSTCNERGAKWLRPQVEECERFNPILRTQAGMSCSSCRLGSKFHYDLCGLCTLRDKIKAREGVRHVPETPPLCRYND